jgi:hypothetical protein
MFTFLRADENSSDNIRDFEKPVVLDAPIDSQWVWLRTQSGVLRRFFLVPLWNGQPIDERSSQSPVEVCRKGGEA